MKAETLLESAREFREHGEWQTTRRNDDDSRWEDRYAAAFAAEREALARDEERETCAKIADGYRMTGPSPIGPLHGAGWNDAQSRIAAAIRSRKEGSRG